VRFRAGPVAIINTEKSYTEILMILKVASPAK
jgi:hypothetical protein